MEGYAFIERRLVPWLDAKSDAVESIAGVKTRIAADPQFSAA
jgi:hypothetical protein